MKSAKNEYRIVPNFIVHNFHNYKIITKILLTKFLLIDVLIPDSLMNFNHNGLMSSKFS